MQWDSSWNTAVALAIVAVIVPCAENATGRHTRKASDG